MEKYSLYDSAGEQALGEYAQIEEQYNNVRNDFLDLFQLEYNDNLKDTDPGKVHKGYMSTNYGEYLKRDEAYWVHRKKL